MKRLRILAAAALLWLVISALLAPAGEVGQRAVRQVRVTAERASVYIEASRSSSRIDIVSKGTLLNLLQTNKVRGSWYYVTYSSSRYGTRVSGFVLDSAVEVVGEASPAAPENKKPEEKTAAVPPLPPVQPEARVREETKPELPPPKVEKSLVATSLPGAMRIMLPPASPPQDRFWRLIETAETPKKPAEAEIPAPEPPRISEAVVHTGIPKGRDYSFPRGTRPLQDPPWKITEPVPVEPERPVSKLEPPPAKKEEAKPKEATPPPAPPKKATPPPDPKEKQAPPGSITRPSRLPGVRKSPGGLSISLGYGTSFGGAGGCLQVSTGGGIALHAGAGIFPTTLVYSDTDWVKNETLWSVGLKYYLPIQSSLFYPYLDLQYGGLRVEAAQVVIGLWDYDYVYSQEQKSLWGPSILAGVEVRRGRLGICGALGVSYVATSWDYLQDKVALSFDTSLVVHF